LNQERISEWIGDLRKNVQIPSPIKKESKALALGKQVKAEALNPNVHQSVI